MRELYDVIRDVARDKGRAVGDQSDVRSDVDDGEFIQVSWRQPHS